MIDEGVKGIESEGFEEEGLQDHIGHWVDPWGIAAVSRSGSCVSSQLMPYSVSIAGCLLVSEQGSEFYYCGEGDDRRR